MHQNSQNNAAPGGPASGPVNVPPQVPSPLPEDNPSRSLYSVYVNEEPPVGSPNGPHLLVGTPTTKTERTTSIWSEHHVSSRLNSFNEPKPSLGPIGKGNDCAIDDDDEPEQAVEDDDAGEYIEEDFFPSSLTDLLTPQERKRRGSRPSSSNLPRPIGLTMAANAQQARTNSVSHSHSNTNGSAIPLATSLGTSLGSNIWSPPGEGSPRFGSFFQQYYGRENGSKPPIAMSPGGSSLKNMSSLAAHLPGGSSNQVDVPSHVTEEDEPVDSEKRVKKDVFDVDDDTQFFMDQ